MLAFHGQHAFALGTVVTLAERPRGAGLPGPDLGLRRSSRLVATAAEIEPNYVTHVRLAAAGK